MRFQHKDIDIEISRTENARGCGLPTSVYVRDTLVKEIQARQLAQVGQSITVEYDGLDADYLSGRYRQVVRFLINGQPVRITNHRSAAYYQRKRFGSRW